MDGVYEDLTVKVQLKVSKSSVSGEKENDSKLGRPFSEFSLKVNWPGGKGKNKEDHG